MADWTTLEEIEARAKRIEQLAQAARLECVNAKRVVASMRRGGGHNAKKIAEAIRAILSGITLNGSLAPTTGTIAKTLAVETEDLTNKTLVEVSPLWDEEITSVTVQVNPGSIGRSRINVYCTPGNEPLDGFLAGHKVKFSGASVAGWNDVEYEIHSPAMASTVNSIELTTVLSGTDTTEPNIIIYREA